MSARRGGADDRRAWDDRERSSLQFHAMPGRLIRRARPISTTLHEEGRGCLDLASVRFAAPWRSAHPGVDATRVSRFAAFSTAPPSAAPRTGSRPRAGSGAGDRRITLIALADEGAGLLVRVEPAGQRVQRRIFGSLAPDDRATVLRPLAGPAAMHDEVTPAPQQVLDPP